MPFPLIPLAVAAYGIYNAEKQKSEAKKGLDELNKMGRPKFKTGAEINAEAQGLATGLTPQEKAAAQQHLTQLNNTRYQLGVQRNPTLSGAVQAGVQYGSIQGALGLAAQDAQARRQNVSQLIGLLGNQYNHQTGSDVGNFDRMQQNYGLAYRNGQQNEMTNVQGAGSTLYNYQMNEDWDKKYGDSYKQGLRYGAPRYGVGGYGKSTESGWANGTPT